MVDGECTVMDDVEMNDILHVSSRGEETQTSVNVNTGEKPYIGLEFLTHDDAYNYYNSYSYQCGFGILKESIDKSRSDRNIVISRTFVCNKAGKKRLTDKRELGKVIIRKPDKRVGCGAKMKIKLTSSDTWVVSKFVGEHTHDITSPDKVIHHYSHRKQYHSELAKSYIKKLSQGGISASNISRVLNATYGSQDGLSHFTTQQCTDHIRIMRKNNMGNECISIISNFQDRRATDPDFYFAMEVDHSGMMRSVFLADGRSRSSYLSFRDVIVFDVTYWTNNLCLPFAPFTGVNHHRQSTLFGCALLADEQEDTFVWLFTQWLKCMYGLAPKAIITDQDAQIGGAIEKVFCNTRHRFCSWHISKHIAEKEVLLKSQYGDEFSNFFNNWYRSSTVSKCEERWKTLKENFAINENDSSWLSKMYRLREHWVDAYLKDVFWAGMTSSQRSESINAFFDGFVNSRTQLADFVCQYDKAVAARRASEAHEDFMNLNNIPTMCLSHPLEVQAAKIYTREILKLFQRELLAGVSLFHEELQNEGSKRIFKVQYSLDEQERWVEVTFDQVGKLTTTCTCAMLETNGILCRHILHIMFINLVKVFPERYVLPRWKIDARQRNIGFASLKNNGDSMQQCEIIRLWATRAKFNDALELVSKSEPLMSKLYSMLDDLILEAKKEVMPEEIHVRESHIESQVGSITPVVLRDGEEIFIRDPDGPVKTKGRPRCPTRLLSGFETSQRNKETKQRKCGKCGQLGHYRTSCTMSTITPTPGQLINVSQAEDVSQSGPITQQSQRRREG